MTDQTNDNTSDLTAADLITPADLADLVAQADPDTIRDTLRRISNSIAACLSVAIEESGKPEPDRWKLDGLLLAAECLNDSAALVLQPATGNP